MSAGNSTFRLRLAPGLRGWCLAAAFAMIFRPSSVSAATTDADESAQRAFREGVEAARQSRWQDARARFEEAYALSPRPVVLINLAGAQARTGRLVEAAKNYRQIVDETDSAETQPFRKAAADVLPALEQRIPRLRVRSSEDTAGDAFRIDGQVIARERLDEGISLDPGPHTLVMEQSRVERARVLFSLSEREVREIPLSLPKVSLAAPPASPPLPVGGVGSPTVDLTSTEPSSAPRPLEGERGTRRRWWSSPWTWTAVGVVVLAATSTALVLTLGRRDQPFSGNVPPGIVMVH